MKIAEIERKQIDKVRTGRQLQVLRLDNENLRRYVCSALNYDKNECDGKTGAGVRRGHQRRRQLGERTLPPSDRGPHAVRRDVQGGLDKGYPGVRMSH